MAQPFSYMLNVPNPAEAVTGGLQQGVQLASMMERADLLAAQRRQTDLENAALRAKAQMLKDQQDAVKAFYETPSEKRTAADYERLTATLPKEQAENIRAGFEAKTKEQQRQELLFGGQVFSALRSGDRETANTLLRQRAEASRNAGDEAGAKAYENAAEMAAIAPDQAELFVGTTLSALPGGKEFIDNVGKQQEQVQKAALFKPELAKKEAEAAIKDIERQYFSESERARIDLLKAQAGQAKAAAYKSSREASEVGKLTPEKKFKFEADLRQEYLKNADKFREMSDVYPSIKAASSPNATATDRVAQIFGFVKMIDPGSVVRGQDFEALQKTNGYALSPDWFKEAVVRIQAGDPVSDKVTKQIAATSAGLYKAARERDTETRSNIERVAKQYDLDTTNLFVVRQEKTPEEETAARAPRATPAAPAMSTAGPAMSTADAEIRAQANAILRGGK
jgi:hypothetical protein